MTKKHFQWAAEQIRVLLSSPDERDREHGEAALEFCLGMFRHFNPRFDSGRFIETCHAPTRKP